ncbi:Fc.00g077930.m01.CDS01 [Cosmosporella sp. VM-42]
MPARTPKPKAPASEYKAVAEQWAKAKRAKEAADAAKGLPPVTETAEVLEKQREKLDAKRQKAFQKRWWWTVAFWTWLLGIHAVGIWLFTSGFLLTRLVLEEKSNCTVPPIEIGNGLGTVEGGCWHPKSFDRAVVVLIDALRYDFTVPEDPEQAHLFHNAFPFLYEIAAKSPQNAFLRPFIADPPTATLQRLKGLTTGTLPTFIDAGSSFAGTAIEEDNLLMQLKESGKKIAHVGDDTWWSLFPGYFEPNISKAYDSFNVWDLHTVDNGVIDKIFPLLAPERKSEWDLLIGHCLGVDHAGHRYGPDHPAMKSKLQQMDDFIRKVVDSIDDKTLLVVMGDHGMDSKGDHGGESDDEVEAALFMYSKKPFFGRTSPEYVTPPANAKIRPVNQIDLVPTLALLLGIPIPYNNLGGPIEEAFAGVKGNDWRNLAAVSRIASAGIERYQASYFKARGITPNTEPGSPATLWNEAVALKKGDVEIYNAFTNFQAETLQVCKGLWARFDIPRMIAGIVVAAIGVVILMMYSAREADDEYVVNNDAELDYAEKKLELMALKGDDQAHPDQIYHKNLLKGMWDARVLFTLSILIGVAVYRQQPMDGLAAMVVILIMVGVVSSLHDAGQTILNIIPNTFWGWLAVVFTVSQSIGFASNSYTIWEDSILLFFITSFGIASAVAAFRIESRINRAMGVYHSIAFVVLGRLASYSKLCREEQMPYCTSTYYASTTSSTSAPWQLVIPFIIFIVLPTIIKSFLVPTRSYEGLAPTWIGYVLRSGLFLAATYWVIDAADNGEWLTGRLPEGTVKTIGVYVAQMVLALAFVAGTTAFIWAPPCVSIISSPSPTGPRVMILGYANAIGSRYLLLPLNILVACLLLSKPMGAGALAIMMWQILSLAEILDLNGLKTNPIGPIMLALLGNFYFFKTGHQATPSSIQWDAAFIPLFTIRYPWSPLVVILNTFAGQILAAASVPLLSLWKVGPKQKGVLETVARSLGVFIVYFAVEALATMSWAGWLRRHLMLYRVFNPRFILAALLLPLLDLVVLLVTLLGLRSNSLALGEVFGWAD